MHHHRGGHLWLVVVTLCLVDFGVRFSGLRPVSAFTAGIICGKIPGLTPAQRRTCRERPDLMVAVGDGARTAVHECQRQFRHRRWNCTAIGSVHVFGHVVIVGSREAAFTYAITAAAVAHAVTQSCGRGALRHCGCDATKDGMVDGSGGWKWGGCSADVRHGMRMSRLFLDARETEGDSRTLMNLHNNRAGRKAVFHTVQTECKCHGVSGSCTMKTCWNTMPPFSRVGDYLMRKYHSARRVFAFWGPSKNVITSTRRNRPLYLRTRRSKRPHRKPRPREMVYLEKSPNYCEADPMLGSTGTYGRLCNRTSRGTDGCDLMCCGRGYNTHQYTRTGQCHCKFHWCCYVDCRMCTERTEEYTCK